MHKNYLFIDTSQSTNCCIQILNSQFKIINTKFFTTQNNLIDILNPELNQLLKSVNLSFNNINKIYVNIGPGVFTGIRVGVSFAKTFKLIFPDVDIYIINSLLFKCRGNGIALIDAKSNKSYLAIYKDGKELVKPRLVNKLEKENILQKYSHLQIYSENELINYSIDLKIINLFKKCNDYIKLEPLYIKDAI